MLGHYDEHYLDINCNCSACLGFKIRQSSVFLPNTGTRSSSRNLFISSSVGYSSNFDNIEKEENEPIKEISQELEDDGEDRCTIDYSDFEICSEYQEPPGLMDFSPWKNESSGIKELEDDGEDGCYIDYSGIPRYDKHLELNQHINDLEEQSKKVRTFETGATRDQDTNKIDYEGFLSPIVLERFGQYMLKHQVQTDGSLRTSDNWKKGIPLDAYMKSAWRHFHDLWMEHSGYESREGLEGALMGLLFNIMGYTHEILKKEKYNENK